MLLLRPTKIKGDFIICPYCRSGSHADVWLDEEYTNFKNK
jgi:hypothetical protein